MFGLGLATKLSVAIEAEDMRKGFDGLYGLVRDAHAFESAGVGRQRIVGVREAIGEGPLPLALGK